MSFKPTRTKTTSSIEEEDPRPKKFKSRKRARSPRPGEAPERINFTKGRNDLTWLLHNPKLSDIASRVPFGTAIGANTLLISNSSVGGTGTARVLGNNHLPGILKVSALLTGGYSKDINSDINIVGRNIWTKLRAAGTGSVVNDPNDLIITLLAEGQVVAFYGMLKRLLDILYDSNPVNKYANRALVESMGFNYSDLVNKLAQLTYFTNYVGSKINNFVMPKLPYFDQAYEMYRHVYIDQDIHKGQYMYVHPLAFGIITYFHDPDHGTQLTYFELGSDSDDMGDWGVSNDITLQGLEDFADELFSPLLSEEYVMTLNAAILKAYGEDLWRVDDLSVDIDKLTLNVDAEFILQLHNMEFNYDVLSDSNSHCVFNYHSVTPGTGDSSIPYVMNGTTDDSGSDYIITPSGQARLNVRRKHYFDMFTDEPSGSEIILASRWKLGTKSSEPAANDCVIESSDVIVPAKCEVYYFWSSSTQSVTLASDAVTSNRVGMFTNSITEARSLRGALLMLTFTGAPLCFEYYTPDATSPIIPDIVGDVHNFTVIDDSVLRDIHKANVLSLFKVPFLN